MGIGSSPAGTPGAPAASASTDASSAPITDRQKMAISMLLSQMGKGAQSMPGMQQQQMSGQPTTQTIEGGTVINPNAR
jgi:hypothetical protein